jgi:hypothetical protein
MWLLAPPARGGTALLCGLVAIVLPTLLRASVEGIVSESAFIPYLPFVLLAALLMEWRYAAAIALVDAVVADLLFIGPRYEFLEGASDIFGAAVFLLSAGLVVGLVQLVRNILRNRHTQVEELGGPAIFSLEDGEAWVRSTASSSSVRLGPQEEVAGMMQDFLAQLELGKRLNGHPDWPGSGSASAG